MSRRHISQRQAHAFRKRIAALEAERARLVATWGREFTGIWIADEVGVRLSTLAAIRTAARLGHVVICRPGPEDRDALTFHAFRIG